MALFYAQTIYYTYILSAINLHIIIKIGIVSDILITITLAQNPSPYKRSLQETFYSNQPLITVSLNVYYKQMCEEDGRLQGLPKFDSHLLNIDEIMKFK